MSESIEDFGEEQAQRFEQEMMDKRDALSEDEEVLEGTGDDEHVGNGGRSYTEMELLADIPADGEGKGAAVEHGGTTAGSSEFARLNLRWSKFSNPEKVSDPYDVSIHNDVLQSAARGVTRKGRSPAPERRARRTESSSSSPSSSPPRNRGAPVSRTTTVARPLGRRINPPTRGTSSINALNSNAGCAPFNVNVDNDKMWGMMRAQALSKLEPYIGNSLTTWQEHVRSFKLRYPVGIWGDEDRRALLNESLKGTAKEIYGSLSDRMAGKDCEQIIEMISEKLSKGGRSEALQAAAKLKELKKGSLSVSQYCIQLEKWSKLAYRGSATNTLSFVRADALLQQMITWQDSVALTSAIDEAAEGEEYERVKEAALRLERNQELRDTLMKGKQAEARQGSQGGQYRHSRDTRGRAFGDNARRFSGRNERSERITQTPTSAPVASPPAVIATPNANARPVTTPTWKCFICGMPGHVAKDCKRPRQQDRRFQGGNGTGGSNQNEQNRNRQAGSYSTRVVKYSAGCNNIRTVDYEEPQTELIGGRLEVPVRVFGVDTVAMIDSGSQLTIISGRLIKEAADKGVDVDGMILEDLELDESQMVIDASGNSMVFNGCLRTRVLMNGVESEVAMAVGRQKEDMMIIGTNAFDTLGIEVIVGGSSKSKQLRTDTSEVECDAQVVKTEPTMGECEAFESRAETVAIECEAPVIEVESQGKQCEALVCKRVMIAPGQTRELFLSGELAEEEAMLWSNHRAIASGVVSIGVKGVVKVPVTNVTETDLLLKEGQRVGLFGGEGWRPLSLDEAADMMDERGVLPPAFTSMPGRRSTLLEKLGENRDDGARFPKELEELVCEFEDVFALYDHELTTTDMVTHGIETGGHAPIRQKCRPVPFGVKKQFKEILKGLLERGIVEPSASEWASPVVLVEKKDKTIRVCIDYRALNKVIKQDSYPLPKIDQILQTLGGKRCFSTLDLHSGYWQIGLTDDAKEKCAFTTSEGLFQFKVLPFGLSTSPATFQRLMDNVLGELKGDEVHVYIDDILICTDSESRHLEVMRDVFSRIRKANLRLKAAKCTLLVNRVPFLGHFVDEQGVHTDVKKVESIRNFPVPASVSELRTFLGMASYYRKFILKFASVAKPLYDLTSPKNPWVWDQRVKDAFENMKEKLTSAPILAQPDVEGARDGSKPYVIYTDACTSGVGAVLCQEGKDRFLHPIFFASKSLTSAERNYTVTDLEGLAVVYALNKFHHFIYGMKIIVRTDHLPLTSVFKRTTTSNRMMRWALELQRYEVDIQYVKGTANAVADALSRGAAEMAGEDIAGGNEKVVASVQVVEQGKSEWFKSFENDEEYKDLLEQISVGNLSRKVKLENGIKVWTVADFIVSEGDLCIYGEDGVERKIVPKLFRRAVFDEAHGGVWAGHLGAKKVLRRLKTSVFWPSMQRDVSRWHAECHRCYVNNNQHRLVPPLKPYETCKPYEIVGVDILELGQTTTGNRYALVLVDHFSKWMGAYPMEDKSAKSTAQVITSRWICEGGRWPKQFLSDQGTEFMNKVIDELRKLTGIGWITTKGYNPRENGLTERANRTIVESLRKKLETPAEWDQTLPFVTYAYNTSMHESTGESSFFMLHGFDPELVSDIVPPSPVTLHLVDTEDYRMELIEGLRLARQIVGDKLAVERERMKKRYDEHHGVDKKVYPKVGDRVYMRMPMERAAHPNPKLVYDLKGPYRVVETSENSALITNLNGKEEPLRVQFDLLMIVPSHMENVEMTCKKGRGRRKKVMSIRCRSTVATRATRKSTKSICDVLLPPEKDVTVKPVGKGVRKVMTDWWRRPLTLNFCCSENVLVSRVGMEVKTICPLAKLSLGELVPSAPESIKQSHVTSFRFLVTTLSLLSDHALSQPERLQMLESGGGVTLTEAGVAGALSIFRNHCEHMQQIAKLNPSVVLETLARETKISVGLIKGAWDRSAKPWMNDPEGRYDISKKVETVLLLPERLFVGVEESIKTDLKIHIYETFANVRMIPNSRVRWLVVPPPKSKGPDDSVIRGLCELVKAISNVGGELVLLPPLFETSQLYSENVHSLRRGLLSALKASLSEGWVDKVTSFLPVPLETESFDVRTFPFSLGERPAKVANEPLRGWEMTLILKKLVCFLKVKGMTVSDINERVGKVESKVKVVAEEGDRKEISHSNSIGDREQTMQSGSWMRGRGQQFHVNQFHPYARGHGNRQQQQPYRGQRGFKPRGKSGYARGAQQ